MVGQLASSLRRVVVAIVAGLIVIALIVTTVLVILFFAFSNAGHQQVEERIADALTGHYAPTEVVVVKRRDWNAGKRDFSFGGQICFEIDVPDASGRPDRRVAMVAGDNDGGVFHFSGEYESFSECTADFSRG